MGYDKFGCVKLKAPPEWDPKFSLTLQDKKITTRKQTLQDLTKGKSFKQHVNSYTLDEFEKFANDFAENYKIKTALDFPNQYRAHEFDYWAQVEDPLFKNERVTVEYAADLPSLRYGSAFPKLARGKATDVTSIDDERIHPFNLNNLIHAKDSLFQIIQKRGENISGITAPWVYAGMLFASFCWHVEDMYMYSINYMHKGAAKTWYCIPESHKEAFDDAIKEKHCELFIHRPDLLYNIILTMNPLELLKKNIPVYRTEQHPREFIITFPKVYHAGFSHGYNISEAVNIAIPDWIPFGKLALKDYASEGFLKKGSFPFEWIIIENIKRLNEFSFSLPAKKEIAQVYIEIMQKEMKDRKAVQDCYSKVAIKQFGDVTTRYDAHICSTCNNYTFLSYLSCGRCKRTGCIQHISVCDCLNAIVSMNVRFSEKSLEDFSLSVQRFLENSEKQIV